MIDARVYKHRRRLRTKTKVAAVTIGLAVLTLSFLAYSFYPLFQRDSPFVSRFGELQANPLSHRTVSISSAARQKTRSTAQHVFPYSVIPGGALSSRELSEAARREPVVAAHYAGFSVADARVIRLPHDKLAYVSYRLGNHIYWTKTKVELHQGETVLSDGKHLARTRCGNRISDVAMAPVSPQEPDPQKLLSTPFVPAHVNIDPVFPHGRSLYGPKTRPRQCFRPGTAGQAFLPCFRFSVAAIVAPHAFLPLLSAAATWLSNAAFRDNCGAREFPSYPLQPPAFASSDSFAAHSLGHPALTPLAIFGRHDFFGCGKITIRCHPERSEGSAFRKMPRKKHIPHSADSVRNDKKDFFRSLF